MKCIHYQSWIKKDSSDRSRFGKKQKSDGDNQTEGRKHIVNEIYILHFLLLS